MADLCRSESYLLKHVFHVVVIKCIELLFHFNDVMFDKLPLSTVYILLLLESANFALKRKHIWLQYNK